MLAKLDRLSKFAWFVLAYNIFVIVFGGFVRASGSGAGCGSHWPLCNGVVVPQAPAIKTIIEFTHRITSGLTVIFIIILLVWTWRTYAKGHAARWASAACVFFIFVESLLGAGLVLFKLVEYNDSLIRAFSMIAHLANTFLLLAALTLTAWVLSFRSIPREHLQGIALVPYGLGVVGVFILGASGAVAALGDTLFPSESLLEGLRTEFSATAHYLLRLRVLHPPIAIGVGLLIAWVGWKIYQRKQSQLLGRLSKTLIGLVGLQFGLGFLNVWLLAPIWLQLVHLLMTSLIWVVYVLTGITGWVANDFSARVGEEQVDERVNQAAA